MAPETVKTEVEGIEADHQQILLFLKQLPNSDKETRIFILEHLLVYTTEHFNREEQLMYKHDYPFIEAHKEEHSILRTKLATNFLPMLKMKNSEKALNEIILMIKNHLSVDDLLFLQFLEELRLLRAKRLW